MVRLDPVFGRAMDIPIYQSGQLTCPMILLKVWETKASQSFGENQPLPAETWAFSSPHKGPANIFIRRKEGGRYLNRYGLEKVEDSGQDIHFDHRYSTHPREKA